jgi:adenosylcobyric acid synthase
LQAQAAGLKPHTDMNPILIKPTSDTKAQIIIHGKAVSDMDAVVYHDYKTHAMSAVLESYRRLQTQYDIIVVEGAGSPAEINLRDRDIANMGFAEAVDCPVIIIADIDRGGVFAHLVGTLDLLSASEQNRVIGFVINRFRGDLSLLQSGLDWLEQKTGKPVLGVIPYIQGLVLDAEDALERNIAAKINPKIRVAVLAFPRISNHNDFDALRLHPEVEFIWVGPEQPIPPVDLIILPGSKNVRADLQFLRTQAWDKDLAKHLRYGGKVIGICGGMQMLGETICDPLGVEDTAGDTSGLGYLELCTELTHEKILRQQQGFLWDFTTPIAGYEIHCGISRGSALLNPAVYFKDANGNSTADGALSSDGQILGTYLHGIFDTSEACLAILAWCGVKTLVGLDVNQLREQALEKLAASVLGSLDIAALELG